MEYEVTLAIPVYNVEKYIERSLLSALAQTFDSIEFLIVDDKGTDNSIAVVKRIKSFHPRGKHIRIIEHEKNLGVGAARNTAITEARGNYLYFMDSDDEITPDVIALLYQVMLQNEADVAMGSCQNYKAGKPCKQYIYPDIQIEGELAIARWMEKTGLIYDVATWNKLYKLSVLRDNNILCISHHRNEDSLFTFKTVFYVNKLVTISNITYHYCMDNEFSLTKKNIERSDYVQYIEIFDERRKMMNHYSGAIPPVVNTYFLEPFFHSFIPGVLFTDLSKDKKKNFIDKLSGIKNIRYVKSHIGDKDYGLLYWLVAHRYIHFLSIYYHLRPFLKIGHLI